MTGMAISRNRGSLKIEVVFSRVFAAGILVLDLLLVVVHVGHLQPAAEVL